VVKLQPIIELPCLATGVWRRFAVHVFEGKLTLDNMAQLENESETWHAKIEGKLVELVIIHPSQSKMTSDERKKMIGIIKRWEHTREASATVILAQGLAGALHRSVLTGLQMAVPAPHPSKVFGATADAIRWLAPSVQKTCGPEARVDDLIGAVAELTAHFQKRAVRAPMTD
jgi:hypothetical protein